MNRTKNSRPQKVEVDRMSSICSDASFSQFEVKMIKLNEWLLAMLILKCQNERQVVSHTLH